MLTKPITTADVAIRHLSLEEAKLMGFPLNCKGFTLTRATMFSGSQFVEFTYQPFNPKWLPITGVANTLSGGHNWARKQAEWAVTQYKQNPAIRSTDRRIR